MRYLLTACSILLISSALVGCGSGSSSDDGLTKEQHESGDRAKDIIKRSGGDWSKLSDEDKKFFLDKAGNNERAAEMKFSMMAGKGPVGLPTGPGGPTGAPKPGPGGVSR